MINNSTNITAIWPVLSFDLRIVFITAISPAAGFKIYINNLLNSKYLLEPFSILLEQWHWLDKFFVIYGHWPRYNFLVSDACWSATRNGYGNSKEWTLQTTPSKTIRTTLVSALFIDNLAVVLGFLTFQDNIIYVHYQKVTNSFAFTAKRGRKPRLFLKLI